MTEEPRRGRVYNATISFFIYFFPSFFPLFLSLSLMFSIWCLGVLHQNVQSITARSTTHKGHLFLLGWNSSKFNLPFPHHLLPISYQCNSILFFPTGIIWRNKLAGGYLRPRWLYTQIHHLAVKGVGNCLKRRRSAIKVSYLAVSVKENRTRLLLYTSVPTSLAAVVQWLSNVIHGSYMRRGILVMMIYFMTIIDTYISL